MVKDLEKEVAKYSSPDNYFKNVLEYTQLLFCISSSIKSYRENNNNMSQKELAIILNVKPSMISKLESGSYNPTIKFIFDIGKKLETKDYSLLSTIFNKMADIVDKNIYTL